ncbi:putative reverse transcriptase domain-containing protein [Tanacetum coccineum]
MLPKRARAAAATNTANAPMSVAAINQLIETRVAEVLTNQEILRNNSTNGDGSQILGSGTGRPARTPRECTYKDFLNCQPLNFRVKFATCTLLGIALTWWNSHIKEVGLDVANAMPWKTLSNMMTTKMFPAESDKVEKYMGGLPDIIQGNVMFARPKTMHEAIILDKWTCMGPKGLYNMLRGQAEIQMEASGQHQVANQNKQQPFTDAECVLGLYSGSCDKKVENQGIAQRGTTCLECRAQGHFKKDYSKWKNSGNQVGNGNAVARAYAVGTARTNPNNNVITEIGSFDVIIGMDWLSKYQAVIVCSEKIVRVSFGNEILIVRGNGSNNEHGSRINIISCTITQKYLLKGCPIFLAHVTMKEVEDKLEEKRLEDIPIV